tara:strand:- start:387 stop:632 length:246 start_codon:yes stop_codon:yes gene_type:complete
MGRKLPKGWPAFDVETLLVLGELGKMFGRLPHELLELSPYELGLALEVYRQRDATAAQMMERMANNGNGGIPVVPVVVLKG